MTDGGRRFIEDVNERRAPIGLRLIESTG